MRDEDVVNMVRSMSEAGPSPIDSANIARMLFNPSIERLLQSA